MSSTRWDIVVVGGGPAGMAATACAAEASASVLLVDDNPSLGGQIWRGEGENSSLQVARSWFERLKRSRVEVLRGFRIFDQPVPGVLLAESSESVREIPYSKLIICTGARECFLPFPGWTLPNVMGAGGLQAMVKSGLPIAGKTVVVAGSGPLLLPVAAYLGKRGAKIRLIAEQASRAPMLRFAAAVVSQPQKIAQTIGLMRQLVGAPYRLGCWPVEAKGEDKVKAVVLQRGRRQFEVECDYLACGFHLVPNLELAALLGCELRDGAVQVDDAQQTSVPNVYCAGEPTGIGGVDLALVEGQIAALAATDKPREAERLHPLRARHRRFAAALQRAFALREDLRKLPHSDTLLCRCEDVSFHRVAACQSWREAKLHTRCGMGPCQGRVCGAALQFLLGWNIESVRPPLFEARVESIATELAFESTVEVSQGAE
ncbi:MAG TPA: FAD/NAD(P)-binding oxidoreductase [Terriglobales bacterium]|nr:FAD/NAD(P)-binding oxidoreductase [Terriglobales bacterium]